MLKNKKGVLYENVGNNTNNCFQPHTSCNSNNGQNLTKNVPHYQAECNRNLDGEDDCPSKQYCEYGVCKKCPTQQHHISGMQCPKCCQKPAITSEGHCQCY